MIKVKNNRTDSLIDDEYLKALNKSETNRKERREIKDIDNVEKFLVEKYADKFKSLHFEDLSFKEQVKYFNNAKMIVCAHGAVMSNMFFCKEGTKIIEVTCNAGWPFFNKISKTLELNNLKCEKNDAKQIIKFIKKNGIQ